MPDFYVGWYDIAHKEPRRQFVTLAEIERDQFKQGTGHWFGRSVHTAWHTKHFGSIELHLVTLTNSKLNKRQINDLVKDALAFVEREFQAISPAGEKQPESDIQANPGHPIVNYIKKFRKRG